MLEDREYAQRYIDPITAPAHILVHNGQPVPSQKRHIDRLMERPGDQDSMMWHIKDLLFKDIDGVSSIDISTTAKGTKSLNRLLRAHSVVVLAIVGRHPEKLEMFRAAAQRLELQGGVPRRKAVRSDNQRNNRNILFVSSQNESIIEKMNVGHAVEVVAFVDGKPLAEAASSTFFPDGNGDKAWRAMDRQLENVVMLAMEGYNKEAKPQAVDKKQRPKKTGKRSKEKSSVGSESLDRSEL